MGPSTLNELLSILLWMLTAYFSYTTRHYVTIAAFLLLFHGNYARLNYDILEIDSANFIHLADMRLNELRHGEIVFVSLSNKNGVSHFDGFTLKKPLEGSFLRGRLQNPDSSRKTQRIKYGMEAFSLRGRKQVY